MIHFIPDMWVPRSGRWVRFLVFLAAVFFASLAFPVFCPPNCMAQSPRAAVVLSRKIIPYNEAMDGLGERLENSSAVDFEVFLPEAFSGKAEIFLKEKIEKEEFDLLISVGPEATRFWERNFSSQGPPLLYTMVLNPGELLDSFQSVCGLSLSIPVVLQLREISAIIPGLDRLGLIFDPSHNNSFFLEAQKEASFWGMEVIPLRVSSRKQIPGVLERLLGSVDCLWMIPDQTVISESVIQYIIKEALLKNIPAIGYNRFFYQSGALISFVFDYRELGGLTGEMALNKLLKNTCQNQPPVFDTWINHRVSQKLGMKINLNGSKNSEFGP